jgi:hypothetical protein
MITGINPITLMGFLIGCVWGSLFTYQFLIQYVRKNLNDQKVNFFALLMIILTLIPISICTIQSSELEHTNLGTGALFAGMFTLMYLFGGTPTRIITIVNKE